MVQEGEEGGGGGVNSSGTSKAAQDQPAQMVKLGESLVKGKLRGGSAATARTVVVIGFSLCLSSGVMGVF